MFAPHVFIMFQYFIIYMSLYFLVYDEIMYILSINRHLFTRNRIDLLKSA